MIDLLIVLIFHIAPILAAVLVLAKLVLYFSNRSANDSWIYFLFYPGVNINRTPTEKRKRIKKLQNSLSVAVIIVFAVYTMLALLLKTG